MIFNIQNNDLLNDDSRFLQKYLYNVKSQCGEDGIFAEIFNRIGMSNNVCCDVGASDGIEYSNSWGFVNEANWRGVLIEADNDRYKALVDLYNETASDKHVTLVQALVQSTGITLDSILERVGVPVDFDFLSIDVDGIDWFIWKSLEDYRPRVVCIEFNPSMSNTVYYVQDDDIHIQQGASLRAMIALGKDKGYELVATTKFNAIFVRSEDYHLFGIEDNSIHAMYSPGGYEAVRFQFYDGTSGGGGQIDPIWYLP